MAIPGLPGGFITYQGYPSICPRTPRPPPLPPVFHPPRAGHGAHGTEPKGLVELGASLFFHFVKNILIFPCWFERESILAGIILI